MISRATMMGLVAIAVVLAALALPNAAQAQGPTLAADQPGIAANQTLTFTGSGFTKGERVAIWATAPDQSVIGGDAVFAKDDQGQIKGSFHIPDDAIGGRWALTAFGRSSQVPVVATFDVQGRAVDTTMP